MLKKEKEELDRKERTQALSKEKLLKSRENLKTHKDEMKGLENKVSNMELIREFLTDNLMEWIGNEEQYSGAYMSAQSLLWQ